MAQKSWSKWLPLGGLAALVLLVTYYPGGFLLTQYKINLVFTGLLVVLGSGCAWAFFRGKGPLSRGNRTFWALQALLLCAGALLQWVLYRGEYFIFQYMGERGPLLANALQIFWLLCLLVLGLALYLCQKQGSVFLWLAPQCLALGLSALAYLQLIHCMDPGLQRGDASGFIISPYWVCLAVLSVAALLSQKNFNKHQTTKTKTA